jgi:hypothetical protein
VFSSASMSAVASMFSPQDAQQFLNNFGSPTTASLLAATYFNGVSACGVSMTAYSQCGLPTAAWNSTNLPYLACPPPPPSESL